MKPIASMECVAKKFLKLPNIQKYEVSALTEYGFIASIEMDDGFEFKIHAYVILKSYPSIVLQLLEKQEKDKKDYVLVSPYISERTADICEKNGVGYFDHAGNCWFVGHSIYLSERGNKNPKPEMGMASTTIFERSSVVSSLILRELFADINKVWRLKHLSETVKCSIGQVSKVMDFLIKNAWAEKSTEGYYISEPESLLKEWSKTYGKKPVETYSCYSLDSSSVLEGKLSNLKRDMGIDYYLTGFSGGVRYAPVVRYSKVHVYIAPEDILEAIRYMGLKEVDSGANVIIFSLENDSYKKDSRVIGEDMVASPLQVYLDSMQIKGRGEEIAETVLSKEILK
ncbi:MAG: type IV toxin-antitoxin system AbiEi family antitoxin [Roseburia sp.]|nr:type IV toxin-antitoxin system AbiEi family antitoxin [Roseburia sp.]